MNFLFELSLVRAVVGDDVVIGKLADQARQAVGFDGEIVIDTSTPEDPHKK